MIKLTRQKEIEKIVKGRDFVAIADIPQLLGCSASTVRRDIKEMESRGLLTQSQGVVIWKAKSPEQEQQHEIIYHYRQSQNVDIKRQLGAYAANFVEENDTLFLDTGTTMLELSKKLPDITLTVVTNDLRIAIELENKYNVSTIVLGGFVRRGTHTVISDIGHVLDSFHFQKAFFSPAGIDVSGGFMFLNLQAMEVRAKARASAEKCVMIADHTKFGKKGFIKGFELSDCDLLITDCFPSDSKTDWETFLAGRIDDIRSSD